VKPILKWAGGKRQLIDHVISLFPKDHKQRTYHEPFIGSGAIFFTVEPRSGTINDTNEHLMNFYKIVKNHPEELINETLKHEYNKETYYALRDRFNQERLSDLERASLFLYLNKTCFNGLWRVNSEGKFNVPFGRYRNPTIVQENRIREASRILKNIDIICSDFSYILDRAKPGDLCYFDPPYEPISETAYFTAYTAKGFDMDEQIRLCETCCKLDEKGVYFVLSNSYVRDLIELYEPRFRIKTVQARRSINSKPDKRGPIREILVTNIPETLSRGTASLP